MDLRGTRTKWKVRRLFRSIRRSLRDYVDASGTTPLTLPCVCAGDFLKGNEGGLYGVAGLEAHGTTADFSRYLYGQVCRELAAELGVE